MRSRVHITRSPSRERRAGGVECARARVVQTPSMRSAGSSARRTLPSREASCAAASRERRAGGVESARAHMSRREARDVQGSSARRTRSSVREASRAAVSPPVGKSVSMRVEPRPHDGRDPRRGGGSSATCSPSWERRAGGVESARVVQTPGMRTVSTPNSSAASVRRRGAVNGAPASPRRTARRTGGVEATASVCGEDRREVAQRCARTCVAQKTSGAFSPVLRGRRTNPHWADADSILRLRTFAS
jgi:hypothetical protein